MVQKGSVPWSSIGKVGDIILLGNITVPQQSQPGKMFQAVDSITVKVQNFAKNVEQNYNNFLRKFNQW